jgi:serine/threonine-protein kinase HipA
MNRCPITYEPCGAGKYSIRGLRQLSPRLHTLQDLPYSAEQQRQEAVIRAGRMSIQGVQPKLSARLNVKAAVFEFTLRGGRYILKPQHATYPQLPENEAVTMRMATIAGIQAPRHGLIYCKDGSLTYFIKRFDRIGRGGKLAIEDFGQLAGRDRDSKYSYSIERLIDLLDHCTFPRIERARFFRRILFNFLVGNEDMHLKNFSLITHQGKTELAPAYDFLNTTIAYVALGKPLGEIEELALPLGGKKQNITRRLLTDYLGAERLALPRAEIDSVLAQFSRVLSSWHDLVRISFLDEPLKLLYSDLLDRRSTVLGL